MEKKDAIEAYSLLEFLPFLEWFDPQILPCSLVGNMIVAPNFDAIKSSCVQSNTLASCISECSPFRPVRTADPNTCLDNI